MNTNIGTDAWMQNIIKAAKDNRANQLNPNCPAYWSSRSMLQPKIEQPSPLVAILAAAAIGAAATAGTILAIQKIIKIKKEKDEEAEEAEECGELTRIEIEGEEEVKEEK